MKPTADPAPLVHACGFSWRKRALVRRFLPEYRVRFVRRPEQVPPGGRLAVWGARPLPSELAPGVEVLRLEDGFLRSVGLGADLVAPLSWVVDRQGIYFDPSRPSDLEHLLETTRFTPELLARAARLRERVVDSGLTKYNVGTRSWRRPRDWRTVVLVPGQVERDASVRLGGGAIRSNLELLQAVRRARPDAHIVYKPHPDVAAGLRAAGHGESGAHRWCDEVVDDVPMGELLREVDEVHVLTSLAGFEALLRGVAVTTYGLPFYAGWGLTADRLGAPRRTRRLTLDALVAGALLLYPRYASRTGECPIAPEQALDELIAWRQRCRRGGLAVPRAPLRLILRWTVGR